MLLKDYLKQQGVKIPENKKDGRPEHTNGWNACHDQWANIEVESALVALDYELLESKAHEFTDRITFLKRCCMYALWI